MTFQECCEYLDMRLKKEDYNLVQYRLRMIPERFHKSILQRYIDIYLEELEKLDINNYASHAIARHYANRFIKNYKVVT